MCGSMQVASFGFRFGECVLSIVTTAERDQCRTFEAIARCVWKGEGLVMIGWWLRLRQR